MWHCVKNWMRLMRLDPSLNATKGCLYVFCANGERLFWHSFWILQEYGYDAWDCQERRRQLLSKQEKNVQIIEVNYRLRERESERERGAKHIGVCIWMYLVYLQKAAGLFSDMFEGSPTRVESNVRINHAILAHFGYTKCYLQSKSITNQQPIIIFQTLNQ